MSVVQNVSFANPSTAVFGPSPCYGSFSSTQTQAVNPDFPTLAVLPAVYDTADIKSVGVSCAVPSKDIVIGVAGVYKILASAQCDKTTANPGDIEMWIAVNGTAVPNSATRSQINQNQELVMTVEWIVDLAVGDDVNVAFASIAQGLRLLAAAASAPVPAIPSIIVTLVKIA